VRQEILMGVERRQHWSMSDKQRIVTDAEAEGISVAELARRHDVTRQQIYRFTNGAANCAAKACCQRRRQNSYPLS
jgi:transposase-like protein